MLNGARAKALDRTLRGFGTASGEAEPPTIHVSAAAHAVWRLTPRLTARSLATSASFHGAQFGDRASFDSAQFGDRASFGSAQFGAAPRFTARSLAITPRLTARSLATTRLI